MRSHDRDRHGESGILVTGRLARVCRTAACSALVAVACGAGGRPIAAAQVVLDRILVHVGTRIVTESDVRDARALKLVDDTSSDAAAERALENRLLILDEIARAEPPLPPISDADLTARRHEWQTSLGGEAASTKLLGDATMNEASVEAWLRDDLRIRAYIARQFGVMPEEERTKATADWLARLRDRAGLN